MISVTKTYLPSFDQFNKILFRSWSKNWITNRGELVLELEEKLKEFLGVNHILAMTNGTLPIQIAIKALDLKGEIITTPFSYVATTSSIIWENCIPVFVDINTEYLTIDETKIEAAITSNTTAILATHVFGNPCEVEAIEKIALKHKLKVIYDSAHAFGVKYNGTSVFNFGDISTCSFHATKLFHTGEGGAVICNDPKLNSKIFDLHNFGHKGKEEFNGLGINAKMSELQAAMGLAVLPEVTGLIEIRKKLYTKYVRLLDELPVQLIKIRENTDWNYSYFPVIFKSEETLLNVKSALNDEDIFPRRYFYPSLNKLPYISYHPLPVSEKISETILCLPLFHDLTEIEQKKICKIIESNL